MHQPLLPTSSSTWSPSESSTTLTLQRSTSPEDSMKAVRDKAYESFGDFDEHLEDVYVRLFRLAVHLHPSNQHSFFVISTVDWLSNSKAIQGLV